MNYAEKLIEKLIEEGGVTFDEDGRESDYAHSGDCILIDDLVLAVLEKNKEIKVRLRKETREELFGWKDKLDSLLDEFLKDNIEHEQAHAFRELVQACEKMNKK